MKVKTLLARAAQCQSEDSAATLLDELRRVFEATRPLAALSTANDEAYVEEAGPMVRVEFNRIISDYFITMIRPEIRDGKLVVGVFTHHMKDGLGMHSRNWEVYGDLEDIIETEAEQTIAQLATAAKDQAIAHHRVLIERVGVPAKAALAAAKRSW